MDEAMNRLAVDVGDLRKGMYVAELDRPWVEVPLPLQGFAVESDEEIAVLQEYCRRVYVDPERCTDSGLLKDLAPDGQSGAASGATKRERPENLDDNHAIDESRRHPDADALKSQVEDASRTVADARRFLDDAFTGVYRGQGMDVPTARSAISELIVRLTKSPTASMLLTSLNDRDSFTSTHSVHVCLLTLAFCMRSGLDQRKIEVLGLGALLHDVGKAHLPAELVNRPGPLTDDEWQRVKRHPGDGYRILADSGKVPRAVLNIASMHHERRDGSGYPHGLTHQELPGYALATGMINRYHALTSPRPYRGSTAPDRVLQSFYTDADSLYGRRPVEAFIRCVGIYPVGSVVELDNGALAVVVSSRPSARLRPTVQLVRTPDGEPYRKLVLLNLAAEAERQEKPAEGSLVRRIRRVHSPTDVAIDPGAIIAETFGVQIA